VPVAVFEFVYEFWPPAGWGEGGFSVFKQPNRFISASRISTMQGKRGGILSPLFSFSARIWPDKSFQVEWGLLPFVFAISRQNAILQWVIGLFTWLNHPLGIVVWPMIRR